MTVGHILADKGREVFTQSPDATLETVAKELAHHGIGAVVIMRGDRVAGMLSERDIVRELARRGTGVLDTPVSSAMTSKVITCTLQDTVDQVMQKMTAGRFRHLPVIEKGKLVGIVSIGDVVKRRMAEIEAEAHQMREYITTA